MFDISDLWLSNRNKFVDLCLLWAYRYLSTNNMIAFAYETWKKKIWMTQIYMNWWYIDVVVKDQRPKTSLKGDYLESSWFNDSVTSAQHVAQRLAY